MAVQRQYSHKKTRRPIVPLIQARNTSALCENRAQGSLVSVWARLTVECFDCLTKGWKDNCVMARPINANLKKPIEEFGPSAGNDHGDPALCQRFIQSRRHLDRRCLELHQSQAT